MAQDQQLQILPQEIKEQLKQATVVIVKTAWNKTIINQLESGVSEVCRANNVRVLKTITVPGAVEIPFAIQAYHNQGRNDKPGAYIALGCVIKGDTPHFEYVCQSVTQGITILNTQLSIPVIFGVLTVNTEQQALDRLGGPHGHKGREAAETALSMIAMMQELSGE
jgi:6,7-dimethyl-8-ribityllumazine synthase